MTTVPIRTPHNLPKLSSSFIGREREVSEIERLLASTRLLTLTGPGGCGKTRLAIAVAFNLLKSPTFEHGIWFVDLAGLDTASLIPQVIATTLGMPETHDRPLSETLADFLQHKKLLLILDNCEHLLSACAELAQSLLDVCPHLHIVATSREPLNLPSETVWLVPSLALPAPQHSLQVQQLAKSEAIQLFVARAKAALPDFMLTPDNAASVTHICQHLDGIPLAIELAAARVKLLDVGQIAERLNDSLRLLTHGSHIAPPRHQTMRAALDWSYSLLSPPARVLFQRLAVFAGSFTLEAVEFICCDLEVLPASVVLDVLTDLVDKSLVLIADRTAGEPVRYRLLEPIRQYAFEQLREARAEAAVRDRQLAYFIDFSEYAERQLKNENQRLWLERLEKEHDNLRAALAWCTQRADHAVAGLQLAKALHLFWQRRGYWSEGLRWLEQAITNYDTHLASQSPDSYLHLAQALVGQSWLAIYQMDYTGTPAKLERALPLAEASNDLITLAYARGLLALVMGYIGDTAASYRYAIVSVEAARQSNDRWTLAWAMYILGWNAFYHRRDLPAAHAALDESEALFRALGDRRSIAVNVNLLGIMALDANATNTAQACYEEALAIGRELNDMDLQVKETSNLAGLALYQGNPTQAKELFEQVLIQQREWNSRHGIAASLCGLAQAHILEDEFDAAEMLLREALAVVGDQKKRGQQVLIWMALGQVMVARGQARHAARLLGAVAANLQIDTLQLVADDRRSVEQSNAVARAALTPREFEEAFAAGRTLTLEQLTQEMLSPERVVSIAVQPFVPTPQTLRLHALGSAHVSMGESTITNWPFAKVKELLFYLVSHPTRTKAQIGLALWPEATPKQLRNSLSTTLYHLRRTLDDARRIVFEDEVYHFNRALNYQFDVEVFEANLAQASREQSQTPDRAIVLLQEAIALYQGDFVEDFLEGEWFLLRREELRRKCLDALLQVGQLLFAREDYVHAAEFYRRAIEKDEVLEAAHRELMRCYARLGERGQALRHYQTFEQMMRDELGSAPAAESAALYERLKRGEEV